MLKPQNASNMLVIVYVIGSKPLVKLHAQQSHHKMGTCFVLTRTLISTRFNQSASDMIITKDVLLLYSGSWLRELFTWWFCLL